MNGSFAKQLLFFVLLVCFLRCGFSKSYLGYPGTLSVDQACLKLPSPPGNILANDVRLVFIYFLCFVNRILHVHLFSKPVSEIQPFLPLKQISTFLMPQPCNTVPHTVVIPPQQ